VREHIRIIIRATIIAPGFNLRLIIKHFGFTEVNVWESFLFFCWVWTLPRRALLNPSINFGSLSNVAFSFSLFLFLSRSFSSSLGPGEFGLNLRFRISMATATNEITLPRTRYEISKVFIGLLPANQCVREVEGERLPLVKMPTRFDRRPLSSSSLSLAKRRVYGLKHRVSLRTAPAFSLGDYENSDVIARASYIVRSFPDKCPIPLDQPSKIRLSPYRVPPQKKVETKREHPLSLSTSERAWKQMIAKRFQNTKWQIVGKEKRYRRSLR